MSRKRTFTAKEAAEKILASNTSSGSEFECSDISDDSCDESRRPMIPACYLQWALLDGARQVITPGNGTGTMILMIITLSGYRPGWLVVTSSASWKAPPNQTVSCVLTVRLTNASRLVTAVQLVVALRCVLHHALSDTIRLLTTNSETARLWLYSAFFTVLNVFQRHKCWEVFCIHLCTVAVQLVAALHFDR